MNMKYSRSTLRGIYNKNVREIEGVREYFITLALKIPRI